MRTRFFLAVMAVVLWPALTMAQQQTNMGYMNIGPGTPQVPYVGAPTMQPVSTNPYYPTYPQPAASAAANGTYFAQPGSCDSGGCSGCAGGCGGSCDSGGQACGGACGGNCGGGCGGGLMGGARRPLRGGGLAGGDCVGPNVGCNYFSMFGGISHLRDQNSTGFQRDLWLLFGDEVTAGFAIGCYRTSNLRTEFEYTYRSHDADASIFNGNPIPTNTVSGDQVAHAGMFNIAYDIGQRRFAPYIGVGVGMATLESDVQYGGMGATLNGDDTAIAYQWMLGVNYRRSSRVTLFGEFKYFEIIEPKLNRFGGPPVGAGGPANIILDSQYMARDILVGVRITR